MVEGALRSSGIWTELVASGGSGGAEDGAAMVEASKCQRAIESGIKLQSERQFSKSEIEANLGCVVPFGLQPPPCLNPSMFPLPEYCSQ